MQNQEMKPNLPKFIGEQMYNYVSKDRMFPTIHEFLGENTFSYSMNPRLPKIFYY
jgi:hypothetical protein